MAEVRFINPETLAKPPSYTHVVEVVGACRTVHISGQLGTDLEGQVVGDFRAQAVQVFENLKAALASVGATFADAGTYDMIVGNAGGTAGAARPRHRASAPRRRYGR